jgi:predicted lipoprotein with Yx(FWY)xxD motif
MRSRLLLTLALVIIVPVVAHAQWINNGTAICLALGNEFNPLAASDGAGGAIITWTDQRAGTNDIYAQRVDATGAVKWTTDGVAVCTAAGSQIVTSIVADGAGGAIMGWYDLRGGVTYDIYVQRVNSAGAVLWTANGVALCSAVFDQVSPVIISDGAAGAIVAWNDSRGGGTDIYARRVNSTGVPQWAVDGVALCTAVNVQQNPVIAGDGAGGAIATWEDFRGGTYDIYAQRINGAGTTQWAANGVSLCTATNAQSMPSISADGAGGAVVAWYDFRSGNNSDIYAQRVNSGGTSLWAADGVALCTDSDQQYNPVVVWDNTTGAIIAWYDYRSGQADIYARRVTPAGSAVWTYDGSPICTATGSQYDPRIVPDGAGGAVIAWADNRGIYTDVYAQRVDPSGVTKWGSDGMPVSLADFTQYTPVSLVGDGSGGGIVTWYDGRSGPANDIYAQHIEGRFGYWGRPDPVLFAVKDVPADQGGKVRLEWYGSQRDQLNQQTISHYTIWRAIDQAAFASATAAGVPEVKLTDPASKLTANVIRREKASASAALSSSGVATDYFWELIGQQDATYRYAYSFNASTSFDSTASNAATHRFQIVAHSFSQFTNWPSNILTGRSVDNVAPPAPLFLTAQRIGSWVYLKWNGVHLPDLNKYTVYRATSTGVTPIPINFLADDTDTLLTDVTAPTSALYYIVTASDVHQNQGPKSNEASVASTTGAGNLPPVTALTVLQNHPNPFTGETQLQVGLPARGDVRVEIFDVAGRRVRELTMPGQAKGWSTLKLQARDERGAALPSGVYFYRVHAGAETVTRKMVIAR